MLELLKEKIKYMLEECEIDIKENSVKICTCTPHSETCITVADILQGKECGCKKMIDVNVVSNKLNEVVEYIDSLEIK